LGSRCRDIESRRGADARGLTNSPNERNPIKNLKEATEERNKVLDDMLENGFITKEVIRATKAEDLGNDGDDPRETPAMREQGNNSVAPQPLRRAVFRGGSAPVHPERIRQGSGLRRRPRGLRDGRHEIAARGGKRAC
jgi:hypothetical protein